MSLCIRLPELMEMDVNTVLQAIADLKVVHQRLEVLKNLPEHFSENVIKAGAMNRNSWKSKNIIVLRYCWDSMWQSRFFCTILRETCQKPERWQTAHDKTGFQKSWTGASEYWSVCGKVLWKNGSYRSGGWVWTGGCASGTNRIIDTIYDTMYNISRRV